MTWVSVITPHSAKVMARLSYYHLHPHLITQSYSARQIFHMDISWKNIGTLIADKEKIGEENQKGRNNSNFVTMLLLLLLSWRRDGNFICREDAECSGWTNKNGGISGATSRILMSPLLHMWQSSESKMLLHSVEWKNSFRNQHFSSDTQLRMQLLTVSSKPIFPGSSASFPSATNAWKSGRG